VAVCWCSLAHPLPILRLARSAYQDSGEPVEERKGSLRHVCAAGKFVPFELVGKASGGSHGISE
jgi:hypothetical protein